MGLSAEADGGPSVVGSQMFDCAVVLNKAVDSSDGSMCALYRLRRRHAYCAVIAVPGLKMTASGSAFSRHAARAQRG